MFNKVYELSLARGYVTRWGMKEAVRELIQNAIDSDSPFVYEFASHPDTADSFFLVLRSEFAQLTPKTLLLGSSSKGDDAESIGSFGEGYKLAMLVLAREGYSVEFLNGDRLWTPSFRHSRTFGEEMLIVTEMSAPEKHSGLTVRIGPFNAAEVEDIKTLCLRMQDHIGAIVSTSMGDILLERPGKLYVGSLLICDTDLHYSYNVKPAFMRLERDRQTVSSWDLKCTSRDMWYETERFDEIAKMISEDAPDVSYAEYSAPVMVKDACYRLFRSEHPGAVVAKSQAELTKLVKEGMTTVVILNKTWSSAVRGSSLYSVPAAVPIESPETTLRRWYDAAKYHMHADVCATFEAGPLRKAKDWKAS